MFIIIHFGGDPLKINFFTMPTGQSLIQRRVHKNFPKQRSPEEEEEDQNATSEAVINWDIELI